ncbi:MAG: hypothetical protein OEM24_05720 [Paracoccaceae bacterium]|nr:hypothetical protein [Paracoccaceae bacterium]
MRRLARAALTGLTLATGAAAVSTFSQNPFAKPLVERTVGAARLELERAMAREVTPDWLVPRLAAALDAGDRDRVEMLSGLAAKYGVPLSPETWAAVDAALAPPGLAERAYDCALCAADIHACGTLSEIAACALPFELTVAGDVNALRRQAQAALAGEAVDRVESGLALVGIGATVAVLATGGASYVVKAGATSLRVARRMGAITPAFGRVLADAADLPVDWSAVLRAAPLSEITDTARLARLGRIAEDLGTLRANTSSAEALVLLRHVETAEDVARLARLSAATGPETRATLEVLGKARAFRALTRVSDLALAAIGLLAAFAAGLGHLALSLLPRALRRLLLGPVARRRKPRHDRRP